MTNGKKIKREILLGNAKKHQFKFVSKASFPMLLAFNKNA